MALVNTKKMFDMAYKNSYAIGAFNVNNMEITQGIIDAALDTSVRILCSVGGHVVSAGDSCASEKVAKWN